MLFCFADTESIYNFKKFSNNLTHTLIRFIKGSHNFIIGTNTYKQLKRRNEIETSHKPATLETDEWIRTKTK